MRRRARAAAILSALALGVWLGAAAAGAQQEPAQRFEEKIRVTEVLLDVLVTDRDGNVVAGLGPEDFVVEEGGRRVELTGASFYTTRYGAAAPDAAPDAAPGFEPIPASRYFILFFHDQRLAANSLNRLMRRQLDAARESRQWVEEDLQPSDWVAVVGYDVKLKLFQDFTQDREALLQAIDDAARGRDPEWDRELRREAVSPTAPSLARHLPAGKELRRATRRIYDGLRLVAEASGHVVGRKNLLLYSIGFGEIERFSPVALPDERFYPAMEQALNDNNVAVYPIDLTAIDSEHAQADFLNGLASDTGGVYYEHAVSFLTPLRLIAEENTGYYLLSYRAEHPAGKEGYQRVRVSTRDGQLKVRAPRGYRYGA